MFVVFFFLRFNNYNTNCTDVEKTNVANNIDVAMFKGTMVQSGLNISECVILTNSNNDTDLVEPIFFNVILIRYSGKFVFRL